MLEISSDTEQLLVHRIGRIALWLTHEVVFESAWEGRTSAVTNLQCSSSSSTDCCGSGRYFITLVVAHLRCSGTSSYATTAMSYADDYFCNWPTPDNTGLHTYNTPGKHVSLYL